MLNQIFTSLGIDPTKITSEDINFAGASDSFKTSFHLMDPKKLDLQSQMLQ